MTYGSYKMMMGRQGIPRGFACRSVEWLGRRCAVGVIMAIGAPIKNSIHSIHSILGIHSKRRPVDIANRNRYPAFFAKLFFTRKKSGGATHPTVTRFFLPSFFFLSYPRAFRGLSGGQPVPLTGRSNVATATRFFLLSFFFYRKKSGQRLTRALPPQMLQTCSSSAGWA